MNFYKDGQGLIIYLLLGSLALFFLYMIVHLYILDRKPEGKWHLRRRKQVVLIPNMDILNIKLDTSEKTCQQSEQWWFTKLLFLLVLLLFLISCPLLRIVLFSEFVSHFLFQNLLPFLGSCLSSLVFSFSLFDTCIQFIWLPQFLYDFVHHDNICKLIVKVVKALFWVV